ncbi:MAG: aldehyde ferredoxin oxidoreductase family protein [Chloroflexota bacterium]
MEGYGKILHVDLTGGKTWTEETKKYADCIGGRGLNGRLLFSLLKPGIDPLGPDNVLCVSTGPLAGTFAPSGARYNISARSPLTGFFGDSNSGGFWGPELRFAGYDGIVIHGQSPEPVYLSITDEKVEIRDAADLWGKDTWETERTLKNKHHDQQLKVLCIGPAGERLVRFACVINDHARAAGRTGMGAVMGSKKLKAIVVRGHGAVRVARPEQFYKASLRLVDTVRKSRQFEFYHMSGVIGHHGKEDYDPNTRIQGLIGFYYQTKSVSKSFSEVGGKEWWRTHWTKRKGCAACQMHCSHFYNVRYGPFAGTMNEGIDAEAQCWLHINIGGQSKDLAAYGYNLFNRFGMDSHEMGAAIGALMLWYERGIINDAMLKNWKARWVRPKWGDPETILTLIDLTARREGIGDLLAEGPYNFAKKIGPEAEYCVLQCKGMTAGGADRRAQKGGLLNHALSTRGADHLRGSPSLEFYGMGADSKIAEDWAKYIAEPELFQYATQLTGYKGKPPLVIWQEHLRALSDSFGVCSFNWGNWPNTMVYPDDFAELYSAATGIEVTARDMVIAAERIINLEKAFNVREGASRQHDQPPPRWVKEPKTEGIFKGEYCDIDKFNEMLDEYYVRRGWDRTTGLQTRQKLEALGLGDVANELEKTGRLASVKEQVKL